MASPRLDDLKYAEIADAKEYTEGPDGTVISRRRTVPEVSLIFFKFEVIRQLID